MVVRNHLSPDPSNRPDEDFLPSDVAMPVLTSSDSEEEEVSHDGYEVLSQDFVDNQLDNESEDSSSDEETEIESSNEEKEISAFDLATKSEVSELWNSTTKRQTDIVMDSTKEEEIKNVMASIRLPVTAIPPWAEHIPEEEWKQQLINRVNLLNKGTAV